MPPAWLFAATLALALTCLAMAVAETTLWTHFLIDAGEPLSLAGLAFILGAGVYLYRRQRLFVSLPLALPWMIYPVITQGDQIIDNLSIAWMRVVVHLLLAVLFGTPVIVIVLALRSALPAMATRARATILTIALLAAELWIAYRYLGALLIATLLAMLAAAAVYGFAAPAAASMSRLRSERWALRMLAGGVALSLALFVGYKNRPGAYQGSPSYFMDPAQPAAGYPLDRVKVPDMAPASDVSNDEARQALTTYARSLERLLAGYYILDRNYNYHFHNELFLRRTPLLPNYRAAGLSQIEAGRRLREKADRLRPVLPAGEPLGALLEDVAGYTAFNVERAAVLERMSAEFEQTKAGLQHATHLYEGEAKFLGERLAALLHKHRAVIDAPAAAATTTEFADISRSIQQAYAGRIVGF
jgi:hypothetical protein